MLGQIDHCTMLVDALRAGTSRVMCWSITKANLFKSRLCTTREYSEELSIETVDLMLFESGNDAEARPYASELTTEQK